MFSFIFTTAGTSPPSLVDSTTESMSTSGPPPSTKSSISTPGKPPPGSGGYAICSGVFRNASALGQQRPYTHPRKKKQSYLSNGPPSKMIELAPTGHDDLSHLF